MHPMHRRLYQRSREPSTCSATSQALQPVLVGGFARVLELKGLVPGSDEETLGSTFNRGRVPSLVPFMPTWARVG